MPRSDSVFPRTEIPLMNWLSLRLVIRPALDHFTWWSIGEEKVARPPGQAKVRTEVACMTVDGLRGTIEPGGGPAGGASAMGGRSTAIVGVCAACVVCLGFLCMGRTIEHVGPLDSLGLNGAGETADEFIPTGGWSIGEEKVARPPGQAKVRTEVACMTVAGSRETVEPGGGPAGRASAMVSRSTAIVGGEAAVVRRMESVCGVCSLFRFPLHGPAGSAGPVGLIGPDSILSKLPNLRSLSISNPRVLFTVDFIRRFPLIPATIFHVRGRVGLLLESSFIPILEAVVGWNESTKLLFLFVRFVVADFVQDVTCSHLRGIGILVIFAQKLLSVLGFDHMSLWGLVVLFYVLFSGNLGFTAGRGFNPAGGVPGGG
ncbi:magnesium chelatase subunit H [Dorcoceras hygrometricum]|uniref:Magnesium chelatase subunit H n=1 Tax=Dorcoceras hygrometricum TaxID=472368 RepID=A0A2Z7B1U0_9LAMI|nr:magnesium chelatase subunit H [Dorcoceras hygrometricum]